MQAGTNNFTHRGDIYFTQRGDKYGDYDVNGHMEQVDVNEENIFANKSSCLLVCNSFVFHFSISPICLSPNRGRINNSLTRDETNNGCGKIF